MKPVSLPRLACALALIVLAPDGQGANATLDLSFDPGTRANNDIRALALLPDGNILVAGEFTFIAGLSRNYLARLHPNGALDESFASGRGLNGPVAAVVVQPDGKILLGGSFTQVDFRTFPYVARLNTNGLLDDDFQAAGNIDGPVETLALQPDGRILVGGLFRTLGGHNLTNLARLNANGSVDTSFTPGGGPNDRVRSILVEPDGKIVVAGRFTAFDGTSRGHVARLQTNGVLDATFDSSVGADRQIRVLARLPDGRLYIGGNFEQYNDTNHSGIARLFPNGGLDLSFDQGDPDNDDINALAVEPDGKVWIGGLFQMAGGQPRAMLARLNADGTADPAVNFAFAPPVGDEIFALAFQPDGLLLVAGEFRSVDGTTRERLARFIPSEAPPQIRLSGRPPTAVLEGEAVLFIVERIGTTTNQARVNYATVSRGATAGSDFTNTAGTLVFAPGESQKTVRVGTRADLVFDPEEDFVFRLTNAVGAALGFPAEVTVTIFDASPTIQFVAPSFQVSEGEHPLQTNATIACLQLQRMRYVEGQVWSVDYEIIPGTARPGVDFTGPLRGTVNFSGPGDVRCVPVRLINDGVPEPEKSLTVRLVRATGAVLTTSDTTRLTILDDDQPISWEQPRYTTHESPGTTEVIIQRNDNGLRSASVDYQFGNGTATAGEDFVAARGTVTFAPGERTKSVRVTVLDDCRLEADEWVALTLSNPRGEPGLATNATARLEIQDNERAGSFDYTFGEFGFVPVTGLSYASHTDGAILIGSAAIGGRVTRLLRDGSVDTNFLGTGFIPRMPPPLSNHLALITGLMPQPDARILARYVFFIDDGSGSANGGLLRLHPDGSRDDSFLLDSRVRMPSGNAAMAWQTDGKLLLGATAVFNDGQRTTNYLVRLHPNGALDTGFRAALGRPVAPGVDVTAVAVRPDGAIYVAGWFRGGGESRNDLQRLRPDGSRDESFQAPAITLPPAHLALQRDGRLVVGGFSNLVFAPFPAGLHRLLPSGDLDPDFHPPPNGNNAVRGLLLDERERVVAAGEYALAATTNRQYAVRLLPDGRLDPTFQVSQQLTVGFFVGLLPTDDHKIVITSYYPGLYRLNGDLTPRLAWRRAPGSAGWIVSTPTITGDRYRLEATTDFQTWTTLETREATGCSLEFSVSRGAAHRFHRVVRLPAL